VKNMTANSVFSDDQDDMLQELCKVADKENAGYEPLPLLRRKARLHHSLS
jgi:hypothetical protein